MEHIAHGRTKATSRDTRSFICMPRRLVWSEVRDLLDIAACDSVDDLIMVLEEYRADPPLPNEPVDDADSS